MDNNQRIIGSQWFSTADGQEMADMVGAGVADFSILETQSWPLAEVNAAISGLARRHGGFSNYVVHP
jgi:alcohol dehydrogenase